MEISQANQLGDTGYVSSDITKDSDEMWRLGFAFSMITLPSSNCMFGKWLSFNTLVQSMKWKYLLPYKWTRNVAAISDFWPPNVNEGSPNCDPGMLPPPMGIAEELGEMQEARGTRKQDWPQIVEVYMKGMTSAQRLASSHTQNAEFLNLIPGPWCSDCLLPDSPSCLLGAVFSKLLGCCLLG